MFISRAPSRGDASVQSGSGLFDATGLGQELAVLEISGDVFWMRGQERFEMIVRCGGVPGIGALHRQAVPGERVGGLGGDEVFENLAARLLLWLGQGHAHSIFALKQNAKCLREHERANEIISKFIPLENPPGKIAGWTVRQRFSYGND
jgi:hypothetical protein